VLPVVTIFALRLAPGKNRANRRQQVRRFPPIEIGG
jgi:hypothetical protein